MPEVVEAYLLALRVLQHPLEDLPHRAGVAWNVVVHRRREQPAGVDRRLVRAQHRGYRLRQQDRATGRARFRLAGREFSTDAVDLSADAQLSRVEVEVAPLECQQLAAAQPRCQFQQEEFVIALILGLDEESLHFLAGEHLRRAVGFGRQLAALRGIRAEQALLHRLLQRRAAMDMAEAHRAVGQPRAILLDAPQPPLPLHVSVKLLQVALCELVQRDGAERGDDVAVDRVLIALLGGWADRVLDTVLIPIVEPVAEWHIRREPVRLRGRELRFERVEFLDALALGFGEDVLRLGEALAVVADDHAPLPAPVLAKSNRAVSAFPFFAHLLPSSCCNIGSVCASRCLLADHRVAATPFCSLHPPPAALANVSVFPSLCHGLSSFPKMSSMNPPTISEARFCISPVTWV